MKRWYFTFGFGQGHDNCYVVIEAPDEGIARGIMFAHFDDKWFKPYRSADAAGVKEYNLHEITLGGEPVTRDKEDDHNHNQKEKQT